MKETALVIMAAGIGSRFGGGIKQLAPVGPNGEIIMDYSIHDAIEAGRRSSETGSKNRFRSSTHTRSWMLFQKDMK